MSRLPSYKRIIKEDFSAEEQNLISKLGFLVNSAFDGIYSAFDKSITIADNLNQDLVDIDLTVDASGIPRQPIEIKTKLRNNCKGMLVVRLDNLSNPTSLPASAPFIYFEQGSQTNVVIKNVKGLTANVRYRLKVLIIGG